MDQAIAELERTMDEGGGHVHLHLHRHEHGGPAGPAEKAPRGRDHGHEHKS
jgi:hypothetical protein